MARIISDIYIYALAEKKKREQRNQIHRANARKGSKAYFRMRMNVLSYFCVPHQIPTNHVLPHILIFKNYKKLYD